MIDISQLTALISAFRVETEKESISPETVGKLLQDIADLLATVPSENDFNILRFWRETLQQYRFIYDIQQRAVDDHSNVILSLMARSLLDGAASSLTLAIGPASATRAGVLTAEDFLKLQNLGSYTNDLVDTLLGVIDTGALLASPKAFPVRADGRFFEVGLTQAFLEYGLWQDYGTGRETPRGNSGDIGRAKKRKRRKWFSRKYYASIKRLSEFYEENIGESFTGILTNALSKKFG